MNKVELDELRKKLIDETNEYLTEAFNGTFRKQRKHKKRFTNRTTDDFPFVVDQPITNQFADRRT